jgi:hypothetical protein
MYVVHRFPDPVEAAALAVVAHGASGDADVDDAGRVAPGPVGDDGAPHAVTSAAAAAMRARDRRRMAS